ncbi:hypothetical protein CASFOL_041765 [Castilleja foliolosa]|uniref:Uncharacterized protein n=1 Tax=Castilleja foliolosa TaxID=1961234 RepID=A0ABD3B993_9LAMI
MDRWIGVLKIQLNPNSSTFYRVAASLCLSSSPKNLAVPSGNAIFFSGDRVEGTENPVIERLSDPQAIAEILVSKFGGSINAFVVEAPVFNGPFAVYKDFIPSVNENGEPKSYDATEFPASTSLVLLLSKFLAEAKNVILGKQKEPYETDSSSSFSCKPKTALLGFSKGGIILNQLISEFAQPTKTQAQAQSNTSEFERIIPTSIDRLFKSLAEIHYVDVGLNTKVAYINDKDVIGRVSEKIASRDFGIRFVFHGTPRQWFDERRVWIRKEKDVLVGLLKAGARRDDMMGKLQFRERLYFPHQLADLQMHFEIIDVMDPKTDNIIVLALHQNISRMGMFMSFMGKGLPTAQMLSLVMGTLHRQFIEKDIKNLQEFHIAILDIFSTVNSALPGKHYDVPSPKEVEACFQEWKEANESEKRKIFIDFMKRKVSLSRLDDSTLITGIVTPPAAMAAKRAGESLPQLKLIKMIPDVIFVPSATIMALVSVKLSRKMFLGNMAS